MRRPVDSFVKLHYSSWEGTGPEPGDHLVTKRGRRYLILRVSGKTLHCQVVASNEKPQGKECQWRWSARSKRL